MYMQYITTVNSSKNMTSQVTGTSSLRTDFLAVAEPQITMRLSWEHQIEHIEVTMLRIPATKSAQTLLDS